MHCWKRKENFSSYKRKFRRDRVQSNVYLTASSYSVWLNCAFPYILESPSSYMTLPQIPSEISYIWGNIFLFYQCGSVDRFKVREKRKEGWIYWQKKWSWQFRPLDCQCFQKKEPKDFFYHQNVIELWRWICISTCRVLKISCIFRK